MYKRNDEIREVDCLPVGEIEEREDEREGDARDDVDALGARRELGHPQAAAVLARRGHVDLALPHLGVHHAPAH